MIRAVIVPTFATTWDEIVDSFVEALFRSASSGRLLYARDESSELLMVDVPRKCAKILDVYEA